MSETSQNVPYKHWIDRPILVEAVFFAFGSSLLCFLAVFQKSAMNEDITALQGYILPFLFGGISAALVGFFNRRSRRHLMARMNAQAERDVLAAASHAKSECLANMSHELRTPLNAIIGFSSSISCETYGPIGHEKYREYIGDISRSGQHLLELINDILDISAIEAGKMYLREENINTVTAAQEALQVLGHLAEQNEVTLSIDAADDLPTFYGDERRFKQILLNLLSNAIKFTPPGGRVTLQALLTPDNQHVFRVTDTGIGMDADELKFAMTSFGQLDSTIARTHVGTGLGLPLTKGLVELHGGTMEVDTEKGIGTSIMVTFPTARTASGLAYAI